MTKFIYAFFATILIHIVLYFLVNNIIKNDKLQFNTTTSLKNTKHHGYTNIKYVKLINKNKKRVKKEIYKEKEVIKKKYTKVIKKKFTKAKEKIKKKAIKKIEVPKVKKQIDLKKFFTLDKNNIATNKVNDTYKLKIQKEKDLYDIDKLDKITQSYLKLYGDEYFILSKYQKRFLKTNLSRIGQITQRVLKYPAISVRTRQKGINIVEFILYSNGDISDLKITDSSGYTALDQNTIRTIRIAYKDYPKPFEKVKIKIYVRYILY